MKSRDRSGSRIQEAMERGAAPSLRLSEKLPGRGDIVKEENTS